MGITKPPRLKEIQSPSLVDDVGIRKDGRAGWASSDLCTDVLTLDRSVPIPLRLCVSPFFIPLLPFLFHLLLEKEERSWAERGEKEAVQGLNHQRSTDFIFLCLETHACPSAVF